MFLFLVLNRFYFKQVEGIKDATKANDALSSEVVVLESELSGPCSSISKSLTGSVSKNSETVDSSECSFEVQSEAMLVLSA